MPTNFQTKVLSSPVNAITTVSYTHLDVYKRQVVIQSKLNGLRNEGNRAAARQRGDHHVEMCIRDRHNDADNKADCNQKQVICGKFHTQHFDAEVEIRWGLHRYNIASPEHHKHVLNHIANAHRQQQLSLIHIYAAAEETAACGTFGQSAACMEYSHQRGRIPISQYGGISTWIKWQKCRSGTCCSTWVRP